MMRNLIAFRSLKRSWRYCIDDALADIQKAFSSQIKKELQTVDLLFMSYDTEDFTEEERLYILSLIDTKLYQVFWETMPEPHTKIGGYLTIGYGGWRVNRWKCQQEIHSGLKYDRVFETRYDTMRRDLTSAWDKVVNLIPKEYHVYLDDIGYVDNSQLPVVLNDFVVLTSGSTHDVWGYSYMKNSQSMNKLSSIYQKIPGYSTRFGAGEGWGIVFRKSGLIPDRHKMPVPLILRTEQFDYHPVIYSNYGSYLDFIAPVKPLDHLSESKLYKTRMFTGFKNDKVNPEYLVCPAFFVQAMNFYRLDLPWPNKFTLVVNPEELDIAEDFIDAAGIGDHFEATCRYRGVTPIAVLSASDVLTSPIYRNALRFEPVNNLEIADKPSAIFITGKGELKSTTKQFNYDKSTSKAFLFFGETTIWDAAEADGKDATFWSGTALIRDVEGIFPNGFTSRELSDMVISGISKKGLINYPQQADEPAWKVYKNDVRRFSFYYLNGRTILYVPDKDEAEDIFMEIRRILPQAKTHGNFCSWPYEPKKLWAQEETIRSFVEAVIA